MSSVPTNDNTYNRPRFKRQWNDPSSKVVAIRLPESMEKKVQEIKNAFAHRFPADSYPTASLALQLAIEKSLAEWAADPAQLDVDLADFRKRYGKK